jgi:N4-gp56 family major capsid protein
MADTVYGVNDNEAVKLWSAKLAREALKRTYIKRFIGKGSDSMIQQKNETNKGPGDRIRMPLRMQLTGAGVLGDGNLEGNEESLTTFTQDLVINQLRHGVRSEGKMTEQRIPFSIRDEAMMGLADWWADRIDTWGFNHLCGYTPANATPQLNGHNTITAPTRQVWAGAASNDEDSDLTTSDTFSLILIDKAVEAAKVTTTGAVPPPIRPIMVDGKPYFVAFLHPYQVTDLRTTTSASTSHPVLWYDIHRATLQGGRFNNPIFNGALGEYNGCILHESTRVTQGENSGTADTDVRRAVLCGAQAGVMGFGQGHDKSTYDWFEQLFDYGNKLGVKAGCISGLKKSVYNSADFGTIVMSSYAIAH